MIRLTAKGEFEAVQKRVNRVTLENDEKEALSYREIGFATADNGP